MALARRRIMRVGLGDASTSPPATGPGTPWPNGVFTWVQVGPEAYGAPSSNLVATWGGGAPNGGAYTGPYQQLNPADYAQLLALVTAGGIGGYWVPNWPPGYSPDGAAIGLWAAPVAIGGALPVAPSVTTAPPVVATPVIISPPIVTPSLSVMPVMTAPGQPVYVPTIAAPPVTTTTVETLTLSPLAWVAIAAAALLLLS